MVVFTVFTEEKHDDFGQRVLSFYNRMIQYYLVLSTKQQPQAHPPLSSPSYLRL